MAVHNHGPEDIFGDGLDCPERIVNGELKGRCLAPTKKAGITGVPVTFEGVRVGVASISEDGECINIELTTGNVPANVREAFLYNIADGLSTDWDLAAKKRRWFGKTTWGM